MNQITELEIYCGGKAQNQLIIDTHQREDDHDIFHLHYRTHNTEFQEASLYFYSENYHYPKQTDA